jgi:RNA polymerase sigma-70 factor (ECF subfamily)
MDENPCAQNVADLVEQFYALLYRYAYRLSGSQADAEDLTQQTFLTAQVKWDQLRDQERAKSWLCSILRNLFLKTLRQTDVKNPILLENADLISDTPVVEGLIGTEELQQVLDEMPEEFRAPLILFYFEEFSYKEIAEQMEVPIGTIMSRLARGKDHLRRRLASTVEFVNR